MMEAATMVRGRRILRRFFQTSLLELLGIVTFLAVATAAVLQGSDLVLDCARLATALLVVVSLGLAIGSPAPSRKLWLAFGVGTLVYQVTEMTYLGLPATIFNHLRDNFEVFEKLYGNDSLKSLTQSSLTLQVFVAIGCGFLCRRVAYACLPDDD